jgi:hypothetical protein
VVSKRSQVAGGVADKGKRKKKARKRGMGRRARGMVRSLVVV